MSLPIIAVHWIEWILRNNRGSFASFRMTLLWVENDSGEVIARGLDQNAAWTRMQ